jgi:hypothetical protein
VLALVVCGLVALTGAARADDAEVKKLREEIDALRDKVVKTEVEVKLLQARNKQLEQRIQELEKENERLRKKDAAPPAGGANRPPENVEGLVKSVDAKSGLVKIGIGSDAGLQKGHKLDVYRLKPAPKYLGQIEIIETTATGAVGKPLGKAKDAIQEGDSVSSGVLNPAGEKKWGTVKGQVTWDAPLPKVKTDALVVNATSNGLRNVFVWLTDPEDYKKAPPINPALKPAKEVRLTVQQVGLVRRFEPRALAVQAGQAIRVTNATAAADNVVFTGGGVPVACAVAPARDAINNLPASLKPYAVESTIFPAPRAWVRVFDHPYYAVTDADGKFEIQGVPAGKYNIVMWHEETGWVNAGGKRGQTVTIPTGKAVEVNQKAKPVD